MKILSVVALLFVMPLTLSAQQFQGQAVYVAKLKMGDFKITNAKITEETRLRLEEKIRKASEKTFILDFNQVESAYTEEQKLEIVAASPNPGRSRHGKIYKNLSEKREYTEADIFDKPFLITDSLRIWNWKLSAETKQIGGYLCNKATITIPVSEKEKAEYEQDVIKSQQAASNILPPQKPKEKEIIAWYTTEIPVSHGPSKYWGLPGLILELDDDMQTLLCSKVTLNPDKKTKIKRPTSGTVVTQAEFDKIQNDKLESLKDKDGRIQISVPR